jgi:hypothetical protein
MPKCLAFLGNFELGHTSCDQGLLIQDSPRERMLKQGTSRCICTLHAQGLAIHSTSLQLHTACTGERWKDTSAKDIAQNSPCWDVPSVATAEIY